MEFKITDSQREYVDAVRNLAQKDFKPRALKYMDGTFPWENMKQLAEIGVLGMTVSEEFG